MNTTVNLSDARKNLPELADRVKAGHVYILSRRGRELAVLISVDEYNRLKAIEQQQRQKDFDALLAPPPSDMLAEEAARDLAVHIVREQRSRRA
jgi:prevent-host-death family protein